MGPPATASTGRFDRFAPSVWPPGQRFHGWFLGPSTPRHATSMWAHCCQLYPATGTVQPPGPVSTPQQLRGGSGWAGVLSAVGPDTPPGIQPLPWGGFRDDFLPLPKRGIRIKWLGVLRDRGVNRQSIVQLPPPAPGNTTYCTAL
ncbi:hypothetical protein AAFF_G00124150 [Aldrovandia affinis]|uniref:Uncharacterized protein n=1 Tax=Aldrovandia affinis TaxID=143900 RepID=A0AAD7RRE2_9TELE|nr:hypothetical protein AAFF_G00124150 [Aldrovandia affinis]